VRVAPDGGVLGKNGSDERGRSRRQIFINQRTVSNTRQKHDERVLNGHVDRHVGDMGEEELEDYIGFCERILTSGGGEGSRTRIRKEIRLGAGMRVTEAGMRAGESYKIWHARDTDGTLGAEWEKVVVRGARVTGVGCAYLGGVVEHLERRLK